VICAAWQLKVVPLLMGTECLIITKDGVAQKGRDLNMNCSTTDG